jgi:deazaflavin-dependent oxidoreductase (nitroreductase family)
MAMRDWHTYNAEVIEEFRANDGTVDRYGGLPVILLHTIGAKSGVLRITPLIPVFDDDDMFIFATAAGDPRHPAWYWNLVAHPRITIESADGKFIADVVPLAASEAKRMIDDRAAVLPQLAGYVSSAAPREIPVFSITPVR